MAKVGKDAAGCLTWGAFSLEGVEIPQDFSLAPLPWTGDRLQSLWGESTTTTAFCPLPSSPTMSGPLLIRAAAELGPYLHLV